MFSNAAWCLSQTRRSWLGRRRFSRSVISYHFFVVSNLPAAGSEHENSNKLNSRHLNLSDLQLLILLIILYLMLLLISAIVVMLAGIDTASGRYNHGLCHSPPVLF